MKRMASKKSHSWWWDSHISPKNSKWLADNLEEMDKQVKEMLLLIEEEGDSFAKKAEMYYKRRPELVSYVENFYRMYRALAERYNNLTGELLKNVPCSNASFSSPLVEDDLKEKMAGVSQGLRAAGFDFFLGSRGSSDNSRKGSDGSLSTTSDSDSELDETKGNGDDMSSLLRRRILELEGELSHMKDKLEEKSSCCQLNQSENGHDHKCQAYMDCQVAALEGELSALKEKLQDAQEEIISLRKDLQENDSKKMVDCGDALEMEILASKREMESLNAVMTESSQQLKAEMQHVVSLLRNYHDEFSDLSGKLSRNQSSVVADVARLWEVLQQLNLNEKSTTGNDEIQMLRAGQLKGKMVGAYFEHDELIAELCRNLVNLNIKLEIATYEKRLVEEEMNSLMHEADGRDLRIEHLNSHLQQLHLEHSELKTVAEAAQQTGKELSVRVWELEEEVERQRTLIADIAEGKREAIRQLCIFVEHYRGRYWELRQLLPAPTTHVL